MNVGASRVALHLRDDDAGDDDHHKQCEDRHQKRVLGGPRPQALPGAVPSQLARQAEQPDDPQHAQRRKHHHRQAPQQIQPAARPEVAPAVGCQGDAARHVEQ